MAVLIETSYGDFVIDLITKKAPTTTFNFIKLCKIKYYNGTLFHKVIKDFIIQTGDPTGTGKGGESINSILGKKNKYVKDELNPRLKHKYCTVSMNNTGENKIGSQFFIVTSKHKNLEHLKKYSIIGTIEEGFETIKRINDAFVNQDKRPLQDIRIRHTIIIDDPFNDPPELIKYIPTYSPTHKIDKTNNKFISDEIDLNKVDKRNMKQIERDDKVEKAEVDSKILEILRDIPNKDITPDENILFVCKLNPVTTDEDLNIIFSQFGTLISCQVIRDYKTGDSLQYAFVEFETKEACENAYLKMNNVLIDDRRIKVDWTQSVAKKWKNYHKESLENLENQSKTKNEANIYKRKFTKTGILASDKESKIYKNN